MQPPPPEDQTPPPPPPQNQEDSNDEQSDSNEDNQEEESKGDEESTPDVPEEFILDPEACAVDPDLLLFSSAKSKASNSGNLSLIHI